MGLADAAIKDFMSIRQNFADAFNQAIFGEELIRADQLSEANANVVTPVYPDGSERAAGWTERTLDDLQIAKVAMGDGQFTYLILAGQYQQLVHYAMPVRAMLETAMLYTQQVSEYGRRGKEDRGRPKEGARETSPGRGSSGAFLSGLGPENLLHPVIMMVLYLGDEPWDGPRSLWDMLETKDPRILRHCPNYALNLVTPEQFSDASSLWNTEFGKAMYAIALGRKGKDKLLSLGHNPAFQSMDRTTVRMLNTVMKTNIRIDRNDGEKGGSINMCKAMREIEETFRMQQEELARMDLQHKEELARMDLRHKEELARMEQYKEELTQKESMIASLSRKLAMYEAQSGTR